MYGDMYYYNDYELIYLVRNHNEEVLDVFFWKYQFLIKSRMKKLGVPKFLQDDFMQEAYLMIVYAIRYYDDTKKMSFTSYLDMLITCKFISLLRKEHLGRVISNDELINEIIDFNDVNQVDKTLFSLDQKLGDLQIDKFAFSALEKDIYQMLVFEHLTIDEIATKLNMNIKAIYNAKQRILKKIKIKNK